MSEASRSRTPEILTESGSEVTEVRIELWSPVRRMRRVIDLRRAEESRYAHMVLGLTLIGRLALGAAVAGLLLPDPLREVFSGLAVGLVVAAPLLRVTWLAARWYRRGDRRYAAVALALLLVVGAGSVIALVTR